MKGDLIDRVQAAFVDLENALGEFCDDAEFDDEVARLIATVEAVHQTFDTLTGDDERDEDYERAAARYDGEGKDWR